MRFNINDMVRVKLTDTGRAALETDHALLSASTRKGLPYLPPQEDADGWSTWTMWELLAAFQKHLIAGGTEPFETEIELMGGGPEQARREINRQAAVIKSLHAHERKLIDKLVDLISPPAKKDVPVQPSAEWMLCQIANSNPHAPAANVVAMARQVVSMLPDSKPDAWQEAVLNECMKVESCYVGADPAETLNNLINYHIAEGLSHAEPAGQFQEITASFGQQWIQVFGENADEPGVVDLYPASAFSVKPTKEQAQ